MNVSPIVKAGNSSKFKVVTKRGEFMLTLSFTLRTKIWELADDDAELKAATEPAEAIVSRHDPAEAFWPIYIFAEHNCDASFHQTIQRIRIRGMEE